MRTILIHAAVATVVGSIAPALAEPSTAPEMQPPELRGAQSDDTPETIDPQLLDTLDIDLSSLAATPPRAALRLPHSGPTSEWKRADKPDGAAQITVKQPLPLTWDTRVGADLNSPPTHDRMQRPLPTPQDRSTGAAWLNVTVPQIAAVELRANSDEDKNKLGASLSRSVPLGEQYSVTLENKFAVIEPAGGPIAPSAIAPPRTFSTDRLLKFDIRASGTTLAVGTTTSTADNVTRSKLVAEQKIYGPLNVTTALTDVGAPTAAKSISAGFKLNW